VLPRPATSTDRDDLLVTGQVDPRQAKAVSGAGRGANRAFWTPPADQAQDEEMSLRPVDEREAVALRYAEHLTDTDLLTLAGGRREHAAALRAQPSLVLDVLDRPSVADSLLAARAGEADRFSYVSPFLVFAAAVHRVSAALVGTAYVADRTGPRSRLPVFDAPQLAAFAAVARHRLFLTELLASYARVASGVAYSRTARGWRRQRWDELDLPRLAALLEGMPAGQRPALWRRLGDGALFLAGVFPDYAENVLGLVEVARLQRVSGLRLPSAEGPVIGLLEELAARAYEHAGEAVPPAVVQAPSTARRVLTLVAERYLFPAAPDWLSAPGA
jgi:hypothetical protein